MARRSVALVALLAALLLLLTGCVSAAQKSRTLLEDTTAPETEDTADDNAADIATRRSCRKGVDRGDCCPRWCPKGWMWGEGYSSCCQCTGSDVYDPEVRKCMRSYPPFCAGPPPPPRNPWGPPENATTDSRDRRDRKDRRRREHRCLWYIPPTVGAPVPSPALSPVPSPLPSPSPSPAPATAPGTGSAKLPAQFRQAPGMPGGMMPPPGGGMMPPPGGNPSPPCCYRCMEGSIWNPQTQVCEWYYRPNAYCVRPPSCDLCGWGYVASRDQCCKCRR